MPPILKVNPSAVLSAAVVESAELADVLSVVLVADVLPAVLVLELLLSPQPARHPATIAAVNKILTDFFIIIFPLSYYTLYLNKRTF
jgi:hypothetical protein